MRWLWPRGPEAHADHIRATGSKRREAFDANGKTSPTYDGRGHDQSGRANGERAGRPHSRGSRTSAAG